MEELLKAIGCPVFMSQDYEADDYAASLVEKFQGPDLQTYVLTKDHDYFQLVSEYTRMWRVVTKDKLENLKDAYGLFGKEAYEELPSNVFEYTPEIVCSEEGSIRNRFLCFWRSPEIQGMEFQAAKAFPQQQRRL